MCILLISFHASISEYIQCIVQGGPKNRTCLSVDNFATIDYRIVERVKCQKFQNAVEKKRQICIADRLIFFA